MKEKNNLEESLSQEDDGVAKYGKKNKNEKKTNRNKIYLCLLLFVFFLFLLVLIYGLYLINKKDKQIDKFKGLLRSKIYEIKGLQNDLIDSQVELKQLLDKNLQIETEKKKYKETMNCLVEENEKLIKELSETKMKFNEITKRFENGYENIIKEIQNTSKTIVNNNIDNSDNSVDNSDHSYTHEEHHHHHGCNIF
jgi:soluble cytochrome b562